MKVSILDYDAGNLASVYNAFHNFGASVKIISNYKEISSAERLVVPGVGSAKNCIDHLIKKNFFSELCHFIKKDRPILGICLGFQIFGNNLFENGKSKGLGLIDADVKEISKVNDILITHVGWNKISYNQKIMKKFSFKNEEAYFYFCHSFKMIINNDSKLECSDTIYKKQQIPALVLKDNFIGTQFHPEKSQVAGSKIIEKFLTF